jgi:hypothetical protein
MNINLDLNITMSKVIALLIVVLAYSIDTTAKTGGTNFMFALPFVNVIITGKQFFDKRNGE